MDLFVPFCTGDIIHPVYGIREKESKGLSSEGRGGVLIHHVLEFGRIQKCPLTLVLDSEKTGMPDLNKDVSLALVVDGSLLFLVTVEVIVGLETGQHGLELAHEQGQMVFLFFVRVFLIHACNLWEIDLWIRRAVL